MREGPASNSAGLLDQNFDEIARSMGLRVGEMRRARGLTQNDLAQLIPATVTWLSKVERGGQNLTLNTMIKLSNALGVPVQELFGEPGKSGRKVSRGRPRRE